MAEVLASYAVTVLVAWVLLARWLWHHLRLKAARVGAGAVGEAATTVEAHPVGAS